jgi:hypothetical protein
LTAVITHEVEPVVSAHAHCLTRPLNRKAMPRDQVRHDLPPLSRP